MDSVKTFEIVTTAFASITLLSAIVMGIIDILIKPFFLKFNWDVWWLPYVAFPIGAVLGWFTALNAFPWFPEPYVWIGKILTSIACGIGPSKSYDWLDKGQPNRLPKAKA